jgi:hypothetical protein
MLEYIIVTCVWHGEEVGAPDRHSEENYRALCGVIRRRNPVYTVFFAII